MKQNLSEKQFDSLPDHVQHALEQWTIEKGYAMSGDLYGYQFLIEDDGNSWYAYPALSIGHLIEFLADKKQDIHIERFSDGKKYSYWSIATCFDEKWKFEGNDRKELLDVLFDAIKKALTGNLPVVNK